MLRKFHRKRRKVLSDSMDMAFRTLGQLLKDIEWEAIWKELRSIYGISTEAEPSYRNAFTEIRALEPGRMHGEITIERIPDPELEGEFIYDVADRKQFALDFTPWNAWSALHIRHDTWKEYAEPEIAAHCIQKITLHGFSATEHSETIDQLKNAHENLPSNGEADPWAVPSEKDTNALVSIPKAIDPDGLYAIP